MTLSLKYTRYFRFLTLIALCGGIALIVVTGIAMKWVGFSRVLGTYFGMLFPPLALLEGFALFSEKYMPDRTFSTSTVITSSVWSLMVIVLLPLMVIHQGEWQYNFGMTSESLYRLFPDEFKELMGGSVLILSFWLIPLSILSGFIAVLKRWRTPAIRQTLILWQASVVIVVLWSVLLQISMKGNMEIVAGGYFNPVTLHLWEKGDANTVVSFLLVPVFWCALFFGLAYVVKNFGFGNSASGLAASTLIGTGLIFIPHIPKVTQRWITFIGEGGWYRIRTPYLVPTRIWVASLIVLGGTMMVAGLLWLLRREKSTLKSG